jgi:hypothetical protein
MENGGNRREKALKSFTVLNLGPKNTVLQLQLFYSIFAFPKILYYIIYVSYSEDQG